MIMIMIMIIMYIVRWLHPHFHVLLPHVHIYIPIQALLLVSSRVKRSWPGDGWGLIAYEVLAKILRSRSRSRSRLRLRLSEALILTAATVSEIEGGGEGGKIPGLNESRKSKVKSQK